jgi:hypothetical protein
MKRIVTIAGQNGRLRSFLATSHLYFAEPDYNSFTEHGNCGNYSSSLQSPCKAKGEEKPGGSQGL